MTTDVVRVNVGYADESGRRAVRTLVVEVVYEFAFDAMTVTVPEASFGTLADRDDVE